MMISRAPHPVAQLMVTAHLYVTCYTEGFSHFVTSMTAPVASGWSVRRVGLAPTGKRRLLTAHANSSHSPRRSERNRHPHRGWPDRRRVWERGCREPTCFLC